MPSQKDKYLNEYDKVLVLLSAMQLFEEVLMTEVIPGDHVFIQDTCIIEKPKLDVAIKKLKAAIVTQTKMPGTILGREFQRKLDLLMRELKYEV